MTAASEARATARSAPGVAGVVLAGGAGRRMGGDKRRVEVDGVPLLARACAAVRPLCADLLIACRRDDPPDPELVARFDARLVFDRFADAGPLAGLEAALGAMGTEGLAVVVAVDMPWLSTQLLGHLVEVARATQDADAVVPLSEHGAEPLAAAYRSRVHETVVALLAAGERRMSALLDRIQVIRVSADEWRRFDRDGRSLVNVNEPADVPPAGARRRPVRRTD